MRSTTATTPRRNPGKRSRRSQDSSGSISASRYSPNVAESRRTRAGSLRLIHRELARLLRCDLRRSHDLAPTVQILPQSLRKRLRASGLAPCAMALEVFDDLGIRKHCVERLIE